MLYLTDSYKLSHWLQYPPGMTWAQSYFESRGGRYEDIVFFGLQYLLKRYFASVPSDEDIEAAEALALRHGLPFNTIGWRHIRSLGYLPVAIYSVEEGSVNGIRNPLITVESTDPQCAWIVSWVETLLVKLWYPCTVATKARDVKSRLQDVYRQCGIHPGDSDYAAIRFQYHNFGDRGSTSVEAAAVGGAAHLTQFWGTDNFGSLDLINTFYGVKGGCAGYSIPASEHSTVTAWGPGGEYHMIERFLEANRGRAAIACVLDSYDLFAAVRFCCSLRSKVESESYPIFVMRPDSGDPLKIVPAMLRIMEEESVAYDVVNGLKRLRKYRIIWGDAVTPEAIAAILKCGVDAGYSPVNFVFGSGGDLMQKLNRDTCQFAFKCCAVRIGEGPVVPVYKKPTHSAMKASRGGEIRMPSDCLRFRNGTIFNPASFDDVRDRTGS